MSKRYQSDLADKQWSIIQPVIPAKNDGARPRTTDMPHLTVRVTRGYYENT